jgi:hypothetical protein
VPIETGESGEYWRCTAIEPETRLRVGRGIGKTETEGAIELWQKVKQREAHAENPPAILSDGWGGHREALVEVYGKVTAYSGRGRPASRKKAGKDWHYVQMVKQRDRRGKLLGVIIRVVYGDKSSLERTGTRTVYVERTNLSSRLMNGRLVRKTLAFSKRLELLKAACIWEDMVYNFLRPVKTLRFQINQEQRRWIPRSPAMAAGLTDHIWSIRELLTTIPVPNNRI